MILPTAVILVATAVWASAPPPDRPTRRAFRSVLSASKHSPEIRRFLAASALAAPVLLPRNYGSPLPSLDEVPSGLLAQIEEFRSSSAGAFALRIYRDHR